MGLDPGSRQYSDLSVLGESTWISYSGGGNGYDEAGRVKGYTYTGKGYTHTYTYAYAGWDSYREQSITGSSSNSNYRTTTTTLTYDTAGRQTEMREKTVGATLDDRVRTFAFDGNGMIVSRRDGTATSANVFQQTGTAAVVAMANNRYVHAGGQPERVGQAGRAQPPDGVQQQRQRAHAGDGAGRRHAAQPGAAGLRQREPVVRDRRGQRAGRRQWRWRGCDSQLPRGTATSANVLQQTGMAAVVAMANNRYVHAGGQQVASLNKWGKLDVRST
ncbi:hypothetical protein [Stenotrophomonas nitritireducens]|uniref:hypothetical protein n=1 Tax=Stenotrophomonas nitritireducens TaxID=83617 RepID=UPI003D985290